MKRGGLGLERLANLFSVTVMAPVAVQPGSRQPSSFLFHQGFKPGVEEGASQDPTKLERTPGTRPPNWDQCLVYKHLHPQPETAPVSRETGATIYPPSSLSLGQRTQKSQLEWAGQWACSSAAWSCSCDYHRAGLGLETGE